MSSHDVQPAESRLLAEVHRLEQELVAARASVAAAQEAVRVAGRPLSDLEERVRVARGRWRSAVESIRLTEAAARHAGLLESASTTLVLDKYRRRAAEATAEIRALMATSGPLCENLDRARAALREARRHESHVQRELSRVRAELIDEHRRLGLEREHLEMIARVEREERARELAWSRDPHYDPRYDERERVLRKLRPWV